MRVANILADFANNFAVIVKRGIAEGNRAFPRRNNALSSALASLITDNVRAFIYALYAKRGVGFFSRFFYKIYAKNKEN